MKVSVSFTLRLLYQREKRPECTFDRRLGGPRAGMDAMAKRNIADTAEDQIPVFHPATSHFTD
jgi:hypothetical protein